MPAVTVHNIESPSRSDRIFWLLEELKVPYAVKTYYRTPTLMRQAPKSLFEYSLFGKGPALSIDNVSFGESGYVIHRVFSNPDLTASAPADIEVKPSDYSMFWAHAAEAAGMTWLQEEAMVAVGGNAWLSGQIGNATEEEKKGIEKFTKWYTGEIDRPQSQNFIDKTEQFLSEHAGKNFTGTDQYGAGDFMMLAGIRSLCAGGRAEMGYIVGPYIHSWWERVSSRPQFQKAMQRIETEEEKNRPTNKIAPCDIVVSA